MKITDTLKNIFEQDVKHKLRSLTEEYEALGMLIPETAEIDFARGIIHSFHFEPKDETEKNESIYYIVNFLNLLKIYKVNIVTFAYAQIEALMKLKIKLTNKQTEFKKTLKAKNIQNSKFNNMLNFLLSENNIVLNERQSKLIETIDRELRDMRNNDMHEIYDFFTVDDAITFLGDYKNLTPKLNNELNHFIEFTNIVIIIVFDFCDLWDML